MTATKCHICLGQGSLLCMTLAGSWVGRCLTCQGTGELTAEQARWIAEGKSALKNRLDHLYTLRVAGASCGVGVGFITKIEAGRWGEVPEEKLTRYLTWNAGLEAARGVRFG